MNNSTLQRKIRAHNTLANVQYAIDYMLSLPSMRPPIHRRMTKSLKDAISAKRRKLGGLKRKLMLKVCEHITAKNVVRVIKSVYASNSQPIESTDAEIDFLTEALAIGASGVLCYQVRSLGCGYFVSGMAVELKK